MIQKNDYELYFLNNMYSDELIFDMVASGDGRGYDIFLLFSYHFIWFLLRFSVFSQGL